MSYENNLFAPLVDATVDVIYSVSCLLGKLLFGESNRFDIENFFKVCELKNSRGEYPVLCKKVDIDRGTKFILSLPIGLCLKDFLKLKDALEQQIKTKVVINYNNGYIEILSILDDLKELYSFELQKANPISKGIKIPLGYSLDGLQYINLKEHPHSFVVGSTGGGKSVCLKSLMVFLICNYCPSELEIYLGDLKFVEFALFKNVELVKDFKTSVSDVTGQIKMLLDETERRYQLFESVGVTNIFDYNKKFPKKKLKYQILIIEEVVNLLQDSKKTAMKLLKRLIAISRNSGLYCIFSTQRPSADVIDSVVKANISNRIVFHTESEKDSIICLDEVGAETLDIKGRGILKVGSNKTVFQGFYVSDDEVKEYIKPYVVNKKAVEPVVVSNNGNTIFDKYKDFKPGFIENKKNDNVEDAEDLKDLSFLKNI